MSAVGHRDLVWRGACGRKRAGGRGLPAGADHLWTSPRLEELFDERHDGSGAGTARGCRLRHPELAPQRAIGAWSLP
eukprot:7013336-Heterocapsa_arctica.AAC.1